jgi:hypothetical protein
MLQKPDRPAGASAAGLAYHWKKMGQATKDPIFDPRNHPAFPALGPMGQYPAIPAGTVAYTQWETYFSKLVEYVAREFWDRYILDHRSEIGRFLRGTRHTSYQNEQNAGAAVDGVIVANEDRLVVLDIAGRITASRAGLNDFYSYHPVTGCQRIA